MVTPRAHLDWSKAEKIGLYCAQNTRMSVMTAAEDVMAK
jgi:hypothetical protein